MQLEYRLIQKSEVLHIILSDSNLLYVISRSSSSSGSEMVGVEASLDGTEWAGATSSFVPSSTQTTQTTHQTGPEGREQRNPTRGLYVFLVDRPWILWIFELYKQLDHVGPFQSEEFHVKNRFVCRSNEWIYYQPSTRWIWESCCWPSPQICDAILLTFVGSII